jgi:hypothetical protein
MNEMEILLPLAILATTLLLVYIVFMCAAEEICLRFGFLCIALVGAL